MEAIIRFAVDKRRAVTVGALTIAVLGVLCTVQIPVDILPVYDRPAVQVLTFYSGMPADEVANAITNRMERWTGTATGMARQESRSILGSSVITNYFRAGVDPNGALTQVNSLAMAEIPNLPPGTLPPIVLSYDPTATVPTCIVALNSDKQGESTLYDVARYEVRNMIMSSPGANAPVVYGGKLRAVIAYLDRIKMQARGLAPTDVLSALEQYNVFLPTGHAMFGEMDYMIGSNSMYEKIPDMADIPLRRKPGSADFLGDVATPKDSYLIQENVVRVEGRRQVYIPVFKQHGASTLTVVDHLREALPAMEPRLSRPDIHLDLVMDQSVYVRESIRSLITEGVLGAVLCSLVILLFLGQWRMTAIAIIMIPLSILACVVGLLYFDQSINVMTLAGMALAIGPLVDLAIVCLENTHRHLDEGEDPAEAARKGATQVVLPEIVATFSTLLVLAPLALMPGRGQFLFRPMALAVTFTMLAALVLAISFVPSRSAAWLKPIRRKEDEESEGGDAEQNGGENANRDPDETESSPSLSERIDSYIQGGLKWYNRRLEWVLKHRGMVVGTAVVLLVAAVALGTQLRREFFPRVDAGAFEMYARAETGTRIDVTEDRVAQLEEAIERLLGKDHELTISDLGVRADWSAAYTPNAGPMDVAIKVQLSEGRQRSTYEAVELLRRKLNEDPRFADLELAFNAGGTVRSALNEGKPTPINIRIESRKLEKAHAVATKIKEAVVQNVEGVVDARVIQRLDYPEYTIDVDRAKARDLGLTQSEIMKDVISALNSSIQFNKTNFWIDPVSQNQYFVGVQYPLEDIYSMQTVLDVPLTSPMQKDPVPLGNVVSIQPTTVPAEVTHIDLQSMIELTMGVSGRDLGHVAADVEEIVAQFGKATDKTGEWTPYDPDTLGKKEQKPLEGSTIVMTGEFGHMREAFFNFGVGLLLAIIFVYFLMVSLLDSYLVPLVVLSAVPVGLVGVVPVLFLTGTALNVQSLLGVIFMVGIIVANTVLMTDFAGSMRTERGMSPTEAIGEAAKIRARPVVMTALAAFFALLPMAMAIERGSEANAPLGRAVIGGLLAGLVTTLVVVPALYSLVIPDEQEQTEAAGA